MSLVTLSPFRFPMLIGCDPDSINISLYFGSVLKKNRKGVSQPLSGVNKTYVSSHINHKTLKSRKKGRSYEKVTLITLTTIPAPQSKQHSHHCEPGEERPDLRSQSTIIPIEEHITAESSRLLCHIEAKNRAAPAPHHNRRCILFSMYNSLSISFRLRVRR